MQRCLLAFVLSGLFVLVSFPGSSSAVTCPSGHRPITPTELAELRRYNSGFPEGTTCIDTAFSAKLLEMGKDIEFFNSRICAGKTAGLPADFNKNDTSPENWNRIRSDNGYVYFAAGEASMNPGALKCFRQFFELVEKDPSNPLKPCVNAGFRSPAHQRASCLAPANSRVCGRSGGTNGLGSGPTSSCPKDLNAYNKCTHTTGIALDVNESTGRLAQLLARARTFNGFTMVGAGADDPWHIEAGNCVDANFKPSLTQTDTWSGAAAAYKPPTPTSGFADIIRSALGLGTQMAMYQMYQQQQYQPQQPYAGGVPITTAFNDPVNPANPTSGTGGATTGAGATSSGGIGGDYVGSGGSVSDRLYGNLPGTTATGTTLAEKLAELGFGVSTTVTTSVGATTGIPFIPLLIDPNDRSDRVASTVPYAAQFATNTKAVALPTTFGITDVSYDANYNVSFSSYTGFGPILEYVRGILLTMLQYLRPFATQPGAYHED